jgi:hypothetical protein
MSDHGTAARLDVHPHPPSGLFRFIPLFLFIVILFVLGHWTFSDPRHVLFTLGSYSLSWIEVLLLISTVVALVEQMKVSHPGIDNTLEALTMLGMGVVQLVFLVLGAASVAGFKMFNTTEFLELTFISLAAAVVAILINARTLRRTIGVGDN